MKGVVMIRRMLAAALLALSLVLFPPQQSFGSDPPVFHIETVVAGDGDTPLLTLDNAGRPWIGYWEQGGGYEGTMHFAVREAGGWTFETVPLPTRTPESIVVDASGSPAAGFSDGLLLQYLYKSGGVWATQSVGGFGPNASALAISGTNTPFAAFVWSYHYFGYVTLSQRIGDTWDVQCQYGEMGWFNPISAAIDLAIDGNGKTHICVNPIYLQFYYIGSSLETLPENFGNFAIAADSQGRPVISYTNKGMLKTATRDPGGLGTWELSDITVVDGCTKTDIALDANSLPHIACSHRPDGVPKIFYAYRTIPIDQWAIREIAGGRAASIAVDSDGHVHLAYKVQVDDPPGWDIIYATTDVSTPVGEKSWGAMKGLRESKP